MCKLVLDLKDLHNVLYLIAITNELTEFITTILHALLGNVL